VLFPTSIGTISTYRMSFVEIKQQDRLPTLAITKLMTSSGERMQMIGNTGTCIVSIDDEDKLEFTVGLKVVASHPRRQFARYRYVHGICRCCCEIVSGSPILATRFSFEFRDTDDQVVYAGVSEQTQFRLSHHCTKGSM
jgi:hypothetical protein